MSDIHSVRFDPSNMSAFGTLEVADLTPVTQLDFIYGINTQTGISATANSATVDTNAGRLRLQSGTNTAGSAIFQSRRITKYRPGEGMVARFTAVFTAGAASSTQIMGAGNSNDGYFFGYNGTAFGVMRRSSGSDAWVAQTAWNGDKVDGSAGSSFTLDTTKGNVYMIKYPFLGYGNIQFYVQNPSTSRWVVVHTIQYTNSSVSIQVANPNLSFYAQSINAGNNTNLIVYCGSVGFFISGIRSFLGNPKWATDSSKASVTTETCLINLRNATTYNGVTNRSLIRLSDMTIAQFSAGTKGVVIVRFKIGATIGGSPSYATISGTTADGGVTITSGNSTASVDVAGTTVAGGTYIYSASVTDTNTLWIDLRPAEIFISPAEILTISGACAASATIGVSLNWTEDQ